MKQVTTTPPQPENLQAITLPVSSDFLHTYLEQLSDPLIILDKQWNYLYVNRKAGDILGRNTKDLLGKSIFTEFPQALGSSFHQAMLKATEHNELTEHIDYLPKYNKWIERRIHPTDNGLLIFFNDVTERKLQEQKLTTAHQQLECFQEALNVTSMVALTDPNGIITWVNENFCTTTQYCKEELVGSKHVLLDEEKNFIPLRPQIKEAFREGKRWQGEVLKHKKDGSPLWVHSTLVPFRDENGLLTHLVIICQDITNRKEAEKKLEESEKLYRSLIENYSDAAFVTSVNGTILKANQRAMEVFERDNEALLGKNLLDFVSEELKGKISTALPMLMEGKSIQLKSIIRSSAHEFSSVVAIVPIRDQDKIKNFFIKFRDVRLQMAYEKDLALLNDTSRALSTAPSLKEGMSQVIKLLCRYGDFQYGEFWMPLFGQSTLSMKSVWTAGQQYRILQASSEFRTFDLKVDKPEVFGSGKWYFTGNIAENTLIRRKAEAASCGINSFLSVPIMYRGQFLGVFSLFSTHKRVQLHLDAERLQEMMSKLGGELQRRQSNEEMDKFFHVSPVLMAIFTFDGFVKKFNPAFSQILGYNQQEIADIFFPELVHPEDRNKLAATRNDMHKGVAFQNLELRFKCKDGLYRWMALSTQSLPGERLTYVVAQDLQVHKQQLDELERIKIAMESTSDAIGIATDLNNLVYTNKSFYKLLGWTQENLNKHGWTKIFVQPELPYQIVEKMQETGHWEGDVELFDTKGNVRDFNLRANTFPNQSQNQDYLIGIFTDIAEHKNANREVERLNKAVEESANEIYIYNPETLHVTYVNRRGLQNLGYEMEEFEWITPWLICPAYSRYSYMRLILPLLRGREKSIFYRTEHKRKGGSTYPVEVHLSWFKDGAVNSLMAHVIDITEQKRAEDALRMSNERYQLVTRATNDAIWDYDIAGGTSYYGEGYKTLFGHSFGNTYSSPEPWIENIHPEDTDRVVGNLYDSIANNGTEWVIEYRFKCTDGSYKYVKDRGYIIYNEEGDAIRATGALADITEQKRVESLLKKFNEELSKKVEEKTSKLGHALRMMRQEVIARVRTEEILHHSLKEKEVLLKEIHHRVKNNMAIISGLLSLQARNTSFPELKSILKDSHSRINSMALIHELLYQNDNLAKINFRQYIHQLTHSISESFSHQDQDVSIEVDAEEAELDIVHAVPCALILNELITNSYKYAFRQKEKGLIRISFIKTDRYHMLSITDNGRGLPKDFNPRKTKTLGMQLVSNLVRQIGGEMNINSQHGTNFTIVWKA